MRQGTVNSAVAFLREVPDRLVHNHFAQRLTHVDDATQSTLVIASRGSAGYTVILHDESGQNVGAE
jgi:hypothetical protein